MRRIITTAIMAVLISLGTAFAQERGTGTIYVINHRIVSDFDGSQLQNKTVCDYQVIPESGTHVVFTADYTKAAKLHSTKVITNAEGTEVVSYDSKGNIIASTKITPKSNGSVIGKSTSPNLKVFTLKEASVSDESKVIQVSKDEMVYVIDGKVITAEQFRSMSASSIESIRIIKSKDDPDFRKYAKASTNVVMMMSTKK